MAFPKSVGAIELSSIGLGYRIQDDMLKAASVELLIARTICSGKYFIVLGGSVSNVEAAIHAGVDGAGEAIIDQLVLPNVHPTVFPALGQSIALGPEEIGALGVIETFSGVSVLAAADCRGEGRPDHAVPHSRGDGLGRQGALPDDRLWWPTFAPGCRPPPTRSAAAACWCRRS